MAERQRHIEEGRRAFSGRQVLVLLPTNLVGGGANVILREVRAMREMGVDATVFNLLDFRAEFERCYPRVDVPLIYGTSHDISRLASEYDALVGTHNLTIEWLADIAPLCRADRPVFGYYIQDFEPYFYPPGSELFHSAFRSYRAFPELVRFTKTEWNRREIEALVGVECAVVGPSFDVDLFRPRPRRQGPGAPLRVAAMIRPYTPYRAPRLTMEVLEAMSRRFGAAIEIVLFGCTRDDPKFVELPRKFPCRLAGLLDPHQMANLLNEADIFVDFSSHQAMGLTSLEAMACGAAVVVPECGGSASFARPGDNCLVTDTASRDACQHALEQLIADDDLRQRLSRRAIGDVSEFFPERPALRILYALFG